MGRLRRKPKSPSTGQPSDAAEDAAKSRRAAAQARIKSAAAMVKRAEKAVAACHEAA